MKLYTWNVNGIRAILKKGYLDWVKDIDADVICLQETKAHHAVLPPESRFYPGYHIHYAAGERKGYSGVSTWSKEQPSDVRTGFDMAPEFDCEGRILHTSYEQFDLLNIYFPNGGDQKKRVPYKMAFYEACQEYCCDLVAQGRKLVVCGDVNTSHNEIDLARPKPNKKNTGFLPEERAWLDRFTTAGFVDVFRRLHPEEAQYSWWSYRQKARERDVGWRLDYFFVSENLLPQVTDCAIHKDVMGSDHCPVSLELTL